MKSAFLIKVDHVNRRGAVFSAYMRLYRVPCHLNRTNSDGSGKSPLYRINKSINKGRSSDPQTICGILQNCCDKRGQCADRTLSEQQCIDSFAGDDAAVVEQCADCYSMQNDSHQNRQYFCSKYRSPRS